MQSSTILSQFSANNVAETSGNATLKSGQTNLSQLEFRDLLTVMLLSSFSTQGSSEAGSDSLGFQQLLAPIMFGLLEKLLSQNIQKEEVDNEKLTLPEQVNSPKGKPVNGVITQKSHPGHIALDFGVAVGTPVKATLDGEVVFAGWNNEGYGNLVILENGPYRVYYAHLSDFAVKVGDAVKYGQKIAFSGNTGNSTGPHVHYEVRKNGNQIDPASFTL